MRILFCGDAFTDRYTDIVQTKIDPSSGCPVYATGKSRDYPGGSGNAARALEHFGVESIRCFHSVGVKERFIRGTHGISRIDRDLFFSGGYDVRTGLELAQHIDAIVVSDYRCGMVTAEVLNAVVAHARERSIPCVIDAKQLFPVDYRGAVLKCNCKEAEAMIVPDALRACPLVVTGEERPPAFSEDGVTRQVRERPVFPARPFQPCGAGDNFAAFLAFALANGNTLEFACQHAYHAASAAGFFPPFRQPVLPREIEALHEPARLKILGNREELQQWLQYRVTGNLVVTNGCFDLHTGHVENLRACRAMGDQLLVCVNSDESVQRRKDRMPMQTCIDRMRVLAELDSVSAVVAFDENTPHELFHACTDALGRPFDVYAKGGDYDPAQMEREFPGIAKAYCVTPRFGEHSTSRIIQRVRYSG